MANMTFEEVKQELGSAKSAYDLSGDIALYNENCEALKSQDFCRIREQLDKSLERYAVSIKMLSMFTDVTLVQYPELTYEIAFCSLFYLTERMPVYVLCNALGEKAFEFLINKGIEWVRNVSSVNERDMK